jgi:hypothetical protein
MYYVSVPHASPQLLSVKGMQQSDVGSKVRWSGLQTEDGAEVGRWSPDHQRSNVEPIWLCLGVFCIAVGPEYRQNSTFVSCDRYPLFVRATRR